MKYLYWGLAIGGGLLVAGIAYKALSGPEELSAPGGGAPTPGTPGAWSASDIGQGVGATLGPLAGFIRALRGPDGKAGDSESPTDTTDDPAVAANKRGVGGAVAGANTGANSGTISAR